jgi:hypothetical protein
MLPIAACLGLSQERFANVMTGALRLLHKAHRP